MQFLKAKLVVATAVTGLAITGVGAANAATSSGSANASVNTNRIARYTLQDERTQAIAKVLSTTPSSLEDKLKTETMQQILKDAGLTDSSFHDKVKAQVQSDLLAQGYSQTQIDNSLNHQGRGHHMRTDTNNGAD